MITQTIDNITFHMREAQDFSFLSKYGTVFCAFSQHDSGNISFGTKDGKVKHFIKVAGAKTVEYDGELKAAVEALKKAMPIYEACKHPNLITLVEHYAFEDLYVAVFKWTEGDCLYDHWNFETYSKNPLIKSPNTKFKQLPVDKRLKSIGTMFEFLTHVEAMGYVAVDFYDGSIMYDFDHDVTTICDIDFFRKKPAYNDMGEDFWGTKRLKAPEEYVSGAVIDETTNVFTLGALIFHLFGDYSNEDINQMYVQNCFFPCSLENWGLDEKLYQVSLKAVSIDRSKRYPSVSEFYVTWKEVLADLR